MPLFKPFFSVLITFLVLSGVILITSGFFTDQQANNSKDENLRRENERLKKEIADLQSEIEKVNGRLATVIGMNNKIRDIVDLPRLDEDFFEISLSNNLVSDPVASGGTIEGIAATLKLLESNLQIQAVANKEISEKITDKTAYMRGIPSILPVDGEYRRTSFGPRKNPITQKPQFHTGLDMGGKMGDRIIATADGIVEKAEVFGGYGNCVIVNHGNGYKTLYGHCSKILVKKGDKVSRGDLIALVGSTGLSTGPHLHYEVIYNDEHLNPADFFFDSNKAAFEKK
ncbi:MAG: peptidoglycan DD-metalloendopeptidase family protein [Ignavibacteriales bacterium]|nr:peptidoglycan DD-metalloendopeptidase family protein [Ignavibacteria bacterium]MCZ2142622.1 peptidoglycan DD-metalloendopeptidase family protein [Ignavibacteriales bacterium]WKZ73234.1 MAG: peptidoglycan DD-metalloendopeptidase family protein [Ignavibacteriaceae bacterium]